MRDDEKAALEAIKHEIEEFLSGNWSGKVHKPITMAEQAELELLLLEMSDAAINSSPDVKRPRGRPDIFGSNNPVTIDSYQAFRFVQREMQHFRKRVGRIRVPKKARECFFEFARRLYPNADGELVIQHLRRIAKMPIEEEFRTENWRTINYKYDKNS